MIPQYRNKGILQIVIAVIMAVILALGLAFAFSQRKHGETMSEGWILFWIFFYLGTVAMWIAGGFNLAVAKGYHSDLVGSLFVILYFLGFLCPILAISLPIIVAFGLKDKLRSRKRR